MRVSLTLALIYAATAAAEVPSLTPDNYDELTAGKTVFLKFFAPWCGHCKKMAPDWEKLSAEWAGKDNALVAEVDCAADGKPLCDANGIRGFPTLKYGDPAALEDYSGGREYKALAEFAEANLKPMCSPTSLDLCDDEKKKEIETLMAETLESLDSKIAEEEKKLEEAETTFREEVQKLQEAYQGLVDAKEATISSVKSSGLGLMKAVKAHAAKAGSGSDEL